ncbi:MAG: hypothetical protein QOD98_1742 [Nocardioidaceae bacterium]|jgi:subtilisin-like proprotein convertase family protein|nr:hypothetical protein [Nocardioidaceae bacterium]
MGKKKFVAALGAASLSASMAAMFMSAPSQASGTDATYTPQNTAAINPPDNSGTGTFTNLAVDGTGGLVTDVNVRLNNINHAFGEDLEVELTGPNGQTVALMSDACGNNIAVTAATLTFDDEATASLPGATTCVTGSFKTTNFTDDPDLWPVAPTSNSLSVFDGINANGQWTIHADDDQLGGTGGISGGFTLIITTGAFSVLIPGSGGVGPASPYPITIPVGGQSGNITDLNVVLKGVTHRFVDDLDILLVGPNGAKVMLVSDPCGDVVETNVTWTIDDQAAAPLPALFTGTTATCGTGSFKPTDSTPGDVMPAPAPAGPYGTALSAFNGISPNGNWLIYAQDDLGGGDGFLIDLPLLTFQTTDVIAPQTTLIKKPHTGFKTSAKVTFSSSEAGSHFECKLDSGKYKACSSPNKLKHLKVGKHKFFVRAIDASGNVDSTPAKAKWRVLKRK